MSGMGQRGVMSHSVFDQSAYERERSRLPRFIVRPPKGDKDWYEHERSWELVYEWSVSDYLTRGWECRCIQADDVIVRAPSMEAEEERRRARQRQIQAWTDEFLSSGVIRAVTPSDREEVVRLAESRLREIVNDGFLVLALEGRRRGEAANREAQAPLPASVSATREGSQRGQSER